MKVKILKEAGKEEAIQGIGLSYNVTNYERITETSKILSNKDGGHNKFLESIVLWLDITAPRYWWQEFDTYRVGVTKQSESTIHTLNKHKFSQCDFESPIPEEIITVLNNYSSSRMLKSILPEGFLQRRIVCTNYKAIRNIFKQRRGHKLMEWKTFISTVYATCKSPEYLLDLMEDCNE